MFRSGLALVPLALLGCDNNSPRRGFAPVADAWQIGPIIGRENYSPQMAQPVEVADGWAFTFGGGASPHYVTRPVGSLAGKQRMVLRYRVEAEPGTIIYGSGCHLASPATITLYFAHRSNGWTRDGERWWASFATQILAPGEHEMVAPLDGPWTSVQDFRALPLPGVPDEHIRPDLFADAKANAGLGGMTFGNCEGWGHGASATGPVRVTTTAFEVEQT